MPQRLLTTAVVACVVLAVSIARSSPSRADDLTSEACDDHSIAISTANRNGAGGSDGIDIVLKNTGRGTCTLRGYLSLTAVVGETVTIEGPGTPVHRQSTGPAIPIVRNKGSMLISRSMNNLPSVHTISLRPGAKAYVALTWHEGGEVCSVVTELIVRLPGAKTSRALNTSKFLWVCDQYLDEEPVTSTRVFLWP